MAKKSIVINNWQQKMAQSAFLGFEELRNVDVDSKPGILRANSLLLKKSTGTPPDGDVIALVKSSTSLFAVTDTNKLFKYASNTWTEETGGTATSYQDGVLWKGYIFIPRSTTFNVYKVSAETWTNGWENLNLTTEMSTFVSDDGNLYVGHGNEVAKITEVDGETFDPADTDTYTYTKTALDLPDDWEIIKITELGDRLMIAANNPETNQYSIFPWDKTSSSFSLPVEFGVQEIHTIITANNLVYVIAGQSGSIFATDGTNVSYLTRLPDTLLDLNAAQSVVIHFNAITSMRDKIYFGTSSSAIGTFGAVWSYDLRTNGLIVDHTISTGNTTPNVSISSLLAFSTSGATAKNLVVGWEDSGADERGVDIETATRRYTGYTAYATSQFISISDNYRPSTWTPEVRLAIPLIANEGIKLYYRTAQNASWTQHGVTWATVGEQIKTFKDISNIRMIQIKIELTTPSGSSSSPEVLEVVLQPNG